MTGPAPAGEALLPRIDVHAHYLPAFYREAATSCG
jgi:hypothetical protein